MVRPEKPIFARKGDDIFCRSHSNVGRGDCGRQSACEESEASRGHCAGRALEAFKHLQLLRYGLVLHS